MSISAVAAQLLEGLNAQLPDSGFRLVGFEVELGALVDVDPELLHIALINLVPRVEVRITRVDALLKCRDCGAEYPSDEHPCPVCGSPHADLVHGSELGIVRAWGETIAG